MRKSVLRLIFMLIILLAMGCCRPIVFDGPYKGRVIDADTAKPIEGVVVLGVWYKEIATPAGGVSSYYDADETVSDKKGNFEIKGKGLKILTDMGPMNVLIFKAGYEYIGEGPWQSLKHDGGLMMKKVNWEGNRAIIPLRKLTMEERKSPPDPPSEAPFEKIRLILKEIDQDDVERGLEPRRTWKGKSIE